MKRFLSSIILLSLLYLVSCSNEESPEKFTVYKDLDEDGYGDPNVSKKVTKDEDGYVTDDTDCDDSDAGIHPGATEIPDNEVDENCDGKTSTTFYKDFDTDGYGNAAETQVADTQPSGYVTDNTDCDDTNSDIHPGATEIPDNEVDENCDEVATTTYYQDFDSDGYGNAAVTQLAATQPVGYVTNSTDCNDNNASIHPNATEIKGNAVDEDCSGSAAPAVCGDGVIDIGEQCDDGNLANGDTCSNICTNPISICANGIIEPGEGCDDGNTNSGDGCSSTCQVESGYTCSGNPSVCVVNAIHGNGIIEPGESCDDGNTNSGDGCSSTCQVESGYTCSGSPSVCVVNPTHGNGIIEAGEGCDDGNTNSGDGCSSACQVESGYTCSGIPSVCVVSAIHGNGIIEFGEGCDDGNTNSGDGCSSACQVESGYTCTGSPSVCVVNP